MSRVKQASKRKRLIKAAGVPALAIAGLGPSLVERASALATVDLPQSLSTPPHQRFVGEAEIADVSLATFPVFDKENGSGGFRQEAMGGGGCGCGSRGCGFRGSSSGYGCRGGGCGDGGCCASWGGCHSG